MSSGEREAAARDYVRLSARADRLARELEAMRERAERAEKQVQTLMLDFEHQVQRAERAEAEVERLRADLSRPRGAVVTDVGVALLKEELAETRLRRNETVAMCTLLRERAEKAEARIAALVKAGDKLFNYCDTYTVPGRLVDAWVDAKREAGK